MKNFSKGTDTLIRLAAVLLVFGFAGTVHAQSIPARLDVLWTAPTQTVAPASLPLTGALAITEYQLVIGPSAIAADYAGAPTVVVPAPALSSSQVLQVDNRSTLHARLRACHKPVAILPLICSAWTNEVTKAINVDTTPLPPTGFSIDIVIRFDGAP